MQAIGTALKSLNLNTCSENISKPTEQQKAERDAATMNRLEGDMNDGINCEKCNNKGIYFFVVGDRVSSRDCSCMKARANVRRLRRSGLMGAMKRYTFDRYKATEEWQNRLKRGVMDFAQNVESLQNKWLFVGGGVGAGKTHLCTAASVELMGKGYEMRYMLWVDETRRIKACASDAEKYTELVHPLKTAEVLYIDDLFRGAPTEADIRLAYEIINHRYQNDSLITIISSEKHVSELEDIDSAVGSRIYEKARGHTFNLKKDKNRNYRIRDMSVF